MRHIDRMRITVELLVLFSTLLLGCVQLHKSVPFRHVPSLPTTEQSPYRLGMMKLIDVRPPKDLVATDIIPDVDERVTAALLEEFRVSRMFAEVDFPASQSKEDLILKGEVKRFYWQASTKPIAYVPLVNVAILLGLDMYELEGLVTLHVQLVDAKTDQVVANYEKTSTRTGSASFYYSMMDYQYGAELSDALRDVTKQIKEDMAADLQSAKVKPSS